MRTKCCVLILLLVQSLVAQNQCATVEQILTNYGQDWKVSFPWTPGSCCTGSLSPNGMPLLDTGQPVYCDAQKAIVGINFGHGSTTGVSSSLTVSQSLTGSIPSSLGSLTSLKALLLDKNNLNGNLPDSLKNLKNLVYLDLSYNSLSGSIQVLRDLKGLSGLWLASNQFDGQACFLDGQTSLASINLGTNRFSGPVPLPVMKLSALDCALDNSGLCLRPGNTTLCTGSLPTCRDSDIPTNCGSSTTRSTTLATPTATQTLSPMSEESATGKFSTSAIIMITLCSITGFIVIGAIGYNIWDATRDKIAKSDTLQIETYDPSGAPAPPKFIVIGSTVPTPEPPLG